MRANIRLKTKYNNNYFYNRKKKQYYLSHPVFLYICQITEEKINIETWFNSILEKVYIQDYGYFSKAEVKYYLEKYKFLKTLGIVTDTNFTKKVALKLKKEEIETSLANCNNVTFEVTQQCNLSCKYCTYNTNYDWFEKREAKRLEFNKAQYIIDHVLYLSESRLNKSFIKEISFSFYGGEPLLAFVLVKRIVNYITSKKLAKTKVAFAMTTNGVLLSKYVDFLVENRFDLLISLDGNEIHNSYRVFKNGKESFSVVIKNIEHLRSHYPDYFATHVKFNSVLNNQSNIYEIRQFFKKKFDKQSNVFPINTIGIKEAKKAEFYKEYINIDEKTTSIIDFNKESLAKIRSTQEINELYTFVERLSNTFYSYLELLNNKTEIGKITDTCVPFSKKLFVTATGKILPCENVDHLYSLGYVDNEKIELNMPGIAKKYSAYFHKMHRNCSTCYLSDSCSQCIFHLNINDDLTKCPSHINDYFEYSAILSEKIQAIENSSKLYVEHMKK